MKVSGLDGLDCRLKETPFESHKEAIQAECMHTQGSVASLWRDSPDRSAEIVMVDAWLRTAVTGKV